MGEGVGVSPRPARPRTRHPARLVSPGPGDYWGSVRSRGPSGSSGRGGPRSRAGQGRTPGPGRDVDVEKLGWAARGLHAHQVREHVVACPQRGRACKDQLRTTLPSASGIWTPRLPLKLQKTTQPLLASPSLDLLHLSQCFVTPWSKLLSLPVWSSPW